MAPPPVRCGSLMILNAMLLLSLISLSQTRVFAARLINPTTRHLAALVPSPEVVLEYHDGALLAGTGALNVYLIWYGIFTAAQKSIVTDFLSSFSSNDVKSPSVSSWWKVTSGYKDSAGASIFNSVKFAGETSDDAASLGKNLKRSDIESLVKKSLNSAAFKADSKALYLVLTADSINVEGFCVQSCASHNFLSAAPATGNLQLAYGWIGNSASKCAGKCAWPFANPKNYGGPDMKALIAPNGDVGMDGMIINIATEIAGATSNPFGSGYFQGPASAPLEAVTACTGIFGKGSYSGYPGNLLQDNSSSASFNAYGINAREFLLPALWSPFTSTCSYP